MPRDCNQRLPRYATNKNAFNFPFSYIFAKHFKITDILKPLPYTNEPIHDPGFFPSNDEIVDWIWSSAPNFDKPDPNLTWYLLCRVRNGNYVFYTAHCPKDTASNPPKLADFDDSQSTMSIQVSPRLSDLIMQAFTDDIYSLYERKTMPLPQPLPYDQDSD